MLRISVSALSSIDTFAWIILNLIYHFFHQNLWWFSCADVIRRLHLFQGEIHWPSVSILAKGIEQLIVSMRNVRLVIEAFCFCATFVFSVILGYFQYQEYNDNHDISSVSYRKFNTGLKDIYPSVSICLYSSFGMIFKQDKNILGYEGWKGGNIFL